MNNVESKPSSPLELAVPPTPDNVRFFVHQYVCKLILEKEPGAACACPTGHLLLCVDSSARFP